MQNKCKPIDNLKGCQFMREWGVDSFPDIDGEFYLWDSCGVYVLIDKGDHIELHLAMRKPSRFKSRLMVKDIIESTDKPLIALIEHQYKSVCNLAKKMGFKFAGLFNGVRLDGTETAVIKMEYQS